MCGDRHDSWLSLATHVREAHEAGRDFFACPVCGAGVASLDVHMAAAHGVPLPPPPERRSAPPKDWDLTRRRARARRPKFKSGLFKSEKNARNVHYRSGWELKTYRALERSPDVVRYKEEPFRIEYRVGGEDRGYWPDILVETRDGRRLVVEVKPSSQTRDPINAAKWEHAALFCERRDLIFRVWTERKIDQLSATPSEELVADLICD